MQIAGHTSPWAPEAALSQARSTPERESCIEWEWRQQKTWATNLPWLSLVLHRPASHTASAAAAAAAVASAGCPLFLLFLQRRVLTNSFKKFQNWKDSFISGAARIIIISHSRSRSSDWTVFNGFQQQAKEARRSAGPGLSLSRVGR